MVMQLKQRPLYRKLTKAQAAALKKLYDRDLTVAPSYLAFRKKAFVNWGSLMIVWKGMWVGIEEDGYTHS